MLDLLNTLEQATEAVLVAGGITQDISTGQDSATNVLPAVTVHAQQGDEQPPNSGNYMVTLTVECRSNADDSTLAVHRQFCTDVFTILMADDAEITLSAALSNFHVFGIRNRNGSEAVEDDSWTSTLSMEVYCCLLDMA